MLHEKMEGKRPGGRPTTRWTEKIKMDIEMRGKISRNILKYKKMGNGRIDMAGDFSIIVDPHLWK